MDPVNTIAALKADPASDLDPHHRLRLARPRRFDCCGAPGWGRRGAAKVGLRWTPGRYPALRSETALTSLSEIVDAARRLQGLILRTPLRRSDWLSSATGAEVYLKLEIVQPTSSFKIRGAFNAALTLQDAAGDRRTLVTASAGNHGRALAHAADALGMSLIVFIASDAPRTKIARSMRREPS